MPAVLSHIIDTVDTRDDLIGHHVVSDTGDESHILSRSRRSSDGSEVCKYAKGDWSECDRMIMLVSRQDNLKTKNSSPGCDKTRTITRNCKDNTQDKDTRETTCVFEKPKKVNWTDCKKVGVRQKVLTLLKEKGAGGCPKEKVMSKKCKVEKKNNEHKKNENQESKKYDKQDKCQFSAWSAWSSCSNKNQQRIRKVLKGVERNSCQKKCVENNKC